MLYKQQDFRDGARRTGLVIRHHGGFHGLNPAAFYRTIKYVIVPCLRIARFQTRLFTRERGCPGVRRPRSASAHV